MLIKRKLVKVDTFGQILAEGYSVEGTKRYILAFLTFGFAYSSYYILLKSKTVLSELDDETVKSKLLQHPCRFGKWLEIGKDLQREGDDLYYTGQVAAKDIEID